MERRNGIREVKYEKSHRIKEEKTLKIKLNIKKYIFLKDAFQKISSRNHEKSKYKTINFWVNCTFGTNLTAA